MSIKKSWFQIGVLTLLLILAIEGAMLVNALGKVPSLTEVNQNPNYVPQGIAGQLWRIGNLQSSKSE